jgi:hypothetical protein
MRIILRVGFIVGASAVAVVYALQSVAALVAVLGILVAGLAAGMGAAKWLEWTWYGRQLEAGGKSGAIACGLAGVSAFLSLALAGPHSVGALAARSHLLGIDLGSLALRGGTLGWIGADVAVVLAATVLGTGLAAATTLLFAFGKSARTVEAITQARLAAQAANRSEPLSTALPLPSYPSFGTPPGTVAWHSTPLASTLPPAGTQPVSGSGTPAALPQPPGQQAPNSGRGASTARPVERELNDEEREALARWAQEHAADASNPRSPAPSTYLNSPAPAPKRGRKKQQTRDWLC